MANIVECTRPAANHLGICTKYLDNVIRSCLYSSVLQESQGWKWWTGGSIFCSKVALSYLQVLWGAYGTHYTHWIEAAPSNPVRNHQFGTRYGG